MAIKEEVVITTIYDINLPEHSSEDEMNVIIEKLKSTAKSGNDFIWVLEHEIKGLEVKKKEFEDYELNNAEIEIKQR